MPFKRLTKADHPHSFGAFKPVGHVVVAMRDDAGAAQAIAALKDAGFEDEDILHYSAAEENDEMDRMLRYTSDFAGFGYEVSLMRRYQQLARDGASWLIVFAPDEAHTTRVTEAVRRHGALIAEKYHRLVIEDLL
ncbi:MAG: hypothetical protein WAQ05_23510 [Rubrivivax sp.]